MDLLLQALESADFLRELRRRLHRCPEIGFRLPQTMALITAELDRLGIPFSFAGKGAVVAQIGPSDQKVILLRADCDALAVNEEAEVDYASKNGAMHACGHDLHAAMLLGAASLLKSREKSLSHGVRLLFQPAEETLEGAADAVDCGVCDGVVAAYMFHVSLGTNLPTGTVILPPAETVAPSADFFEVAVEGKGCHGADPASGRDPLAAAARILLGLEHLPAREFPSGAKAALTVGCLQGGESHNVIPHRALLKGTMRCYDESLRQRLRERIRGMAQGIALAHEVSAQVTFPFGCPSLYNDPRLRNHAQTELPSLLKDRFYAVQASAGTAGSEDFAVISRRVPSLMMAVSAGGGEYPLHHPKAVFDDRCIPYGAATLAHLALSHEGCTAKEFCIAHGDGILGG